MSRAYQLISADSHLDLAPDRWTHHVPKKWKERAPRRVQLESGEEAIAIEDQPPAPIGYTRSVGVKHGDLAKQVPTFENSAGTGPPEKRLAEQDQDGVEAEVMFSRVGYLRAVKEDEGYLALNHAYNQFLAEEYSVVAPDRLIPLGVMPTTGVEDSVAEMEYCAKAGMRGVILDRYPNGTGHPTPEDDRFWAASLALNMPVTTHTNAGSTQFKDGGPPFLFPKDGKGGREPFSSQMFRFCGDAAFSPIQMAFAGVWDRFPDLKIYWAETMIGWLPYALWQLDDHYNRYHGLWENFWGLGPLKHMPSHYIRNHSLWGFLDDPVGVQLREAAGVETLLWASDFAHAASDWPDSLKTIERSFDGVPKDDRHLMLAGNAVRFFHLDD
jgi:predicted TIM-barrel fold metal-dependent hydrolase